jgi:hypothetical protein
VDVLHLGKGLNFQQIPGPGLVVEMENPGIIDKRRLAGASNWLRNAMVMSGYTKEIKQVCVTAS